MTLTPHAPPPPARGIFKQWPDWEETGIGSGEDPEAAGRKQRDAWRSPVALAFVFCPCLLPICDSHYPTITVHRMTLI